MKEDDLHYSSAEVSSSLSLSSTWHSSSSFESSSSDGSEGLFSSIASSQQGQMNHARDVTQYGLDSTYRLSSLTRNRRTKPCEFHRDLGRGRWRNNNHQNIYNNNYKMDLALDVSYSSKKTKRRRGRNGRIDIKPSSFHWSSSLLIISLLIWCCVQIATTHYVRNHSFDFFLSKNKYAQGINFQGFHDSNGGGNAKNSRSHQRQYQHHFPHRPSSRKKKDSVSKKEMLKPGCELDAAWQTSKSNSKLLSCQLLHEIDLSAILSSTLSARESRKRGRSLSPSAHLGSGLWRDVWKFRDNIVSNNIGAINASNFVVLKTMKPEHEVIFRNFERHRREAATMSRLTKSSYVANLYAYCGNSIITEFANDLSYALRSKARHDTNDSHNERKRKFKETNRNRQGEQETEIYVSIDNHTKMEIDDFRNENTPESRKTTIISSLSSELPLPTRIYLALQASKAVADMHRSDVIHADITTKQFLVISSTSSSVEYGGDISIDNVQVKINDFNRCRFVPRRRNPMGNETRKDQTIVVSTSNWDNTNNRCTIQIPSAPGSYRSPEEYSDKDLTPQMDVFSLGHVLYEIWTSGETPWRDVGVKRIKNMVVTGILPFKLRKLQVWDSQSKRQQIGEIPNVTNETFLVSEIERAFGRVILKCYAFDPEQRITANNLVGNLTNLLEEVRTTR